jgi:cell division septation protein DedD
LKDHHKKILLLLLLTASALAVFAASFQIGKMLSLAYRKAAVQGPSRVEVGQKSREMSGTAAAPAADKPAGREEAGSGAGPASVKELDPASGKAGNAGKLPMEAGTVRPAGNSAPPLAGTEKPAAPAKREAAAPAAAAPAAPPAAMPPKPAPEPKPTAKAAKKPKEYKVVAASYSTEAGAVQLANRLKTENYNPTVVRTDLPKGRYYRVIVGSHGSLGDAHVEMAALKKLGLEPFCIVE